MSGDTTLQALERLTHMPDRSGNQADRIAGQKYYDVYFTGGELSNVTLTDVTISGSITGPISIIGSLSASTSLSAGTNITAGGTIIATGNISGANLSGTNTGDQTITLQGDVTGTGTGTFTTAIASGVIVNDDVNASAAIALTKLATTTASRALVSSAGGVITPATTTATEIGYVNGVTSAIQAQIDGKQTTDATLTALAAYNTNGLMTQTAADTFTGRTITGTGSRIAVTNGNGVSGNPTLDIDSGYVGQTSITTLGTVGTGTWSATAIAETRGGTNQTTYATGDILYATGANTLGKRTIGSSGDILTVAGGVPTWAAPANTGGLTVIASGTLSTGSPTVVDMTSIPQTYRALVLTVSAASNSVASRALRVDVNFGNGFGSANNKINAKTIIDVTAGTLAGFANNLWSDVTQAAAETASCVIHFPAYQSGPVKTYHGMFNTAEASTQYATSSDFGWVEGLFMNNTTPETRGLTGIRLTWSNVGTGVFDGGTYELSGVN